MNGWICVRGMFSVDSVQHTKNSRCDAMRASERAIETGKGSQNPEPNCPSAGSLGRRAWGVGKPIPIPWHIFLSVLLIHLIVTWDLDLDLQQQTPGIRARVYEKTTIDKTVI